MRKRNIHIQFWLDKKEAETLRKRAKRSGLSSAAYVRHLINGVVPQDAPPPDYYAMMQQLYRIGNTLNQIAQKAHTLNVIDVQRYDAAVSQFEAAVKEITAAVLQPRPMSTAAQSCPWEACPCPLFPARKRDSSTCPKWNLSFFLMKKSKRNYYLEEITMKNIIKNIVNAKKEKNTQKLPMPSHVKKGFRRYCVTVLALALCSTLVLPASATGGDPLTVVNNLSDFIFGMIRAVGMILLGWGIVQVGLSLQSHDPSQRSNGFLTLAGGIIITFAKEILTLITG